MKMRRIIAAALLLLTLQACSSPGASPAGADTEETAPTAPNTITALEEGVWPVNSCTDGLPVPPGAVSWAALDEEHGNCTVSLTDLEETDCEEYMERLRQEGFSVVESVSERIGGQDYTAVCSLLSNGEKSLSISYSPNIFTIYISFV